MPMTLGSSVRTAGSKPRRYSKLKIPVGGASVLPPPSATKMKTSPTSSYSSEVSSVISTEETDDDLITSPASVSSSQPSSGYSSPTRTRHPSGGGGGGRGHASHNSRVPLLLTQQAIAEVEPWQLEAVTLLSDFWTSSHSTPLFYSETSSHSPACGVTPLDIDHWVEQQILGQLGLLS